MKTSIVIFAKSQEDAEEKLDELLQDEYVIKRTKDTAETETKFYRAKKWSENQRATKVHELYIDSRIDTEEVDMCIIPCVIRGETSSWRDSVHYF